MEWNVLVIMVAHAASTPEAAFDSWQSVDKYAEHSLFLKYVSILKNIGMSHKITVHK